MLANLDLATNFKSSLLSSTGQPFDRPSKPSQLFVMYTFQQEPGLNRGHVRTALTVLAVLKLTFLPFHLEDASVTIESS